MEKHQFQDTKTPIQLNEDQFIARGKWRLTYVHPSNPSLVVKILDPEKVPSKQKHFFSIKRSPLFRHPVIFDQNRYDLKEMKRLEKRLGEVIYNHFARIYTILPTNKGPGMVQKLILDSSGKIAPNLMTAWKNNTNRSALIKAIEQFRHFLTNNHIVIRDLYPENLMVMSEGSKTLKLVMVDGFGNAEFFKWSSISRASNNKKIEGKFNRMMRYLEKSA